MQVKQTGNKKGWDRLLLLATGATKQKTIRAVNSLGVRILQLSLGCQVLLELSPSFFCKTWT